MERILQAFLGLSVLALIIFVSFQIKIEIDPPETIVIKMQAKQYEFIPNNITVNYRNRVRLELTTLDITHGFQLDEFNVIDVLIPPGETVVVEFTASRRGTFQFYCTSFCGTGHADHKGWIKVV
jgi:cytochrome c oxidase subunit II